MAIFIKCVNMPRGVGWALNALAYVDVAPDPRRPGMTDSLTRSLLPRGCFLLAWPQRNANARGWPGNLGLSVGDPVLLWQRQRMGRQQWLITGVAEIRSLQPRQNPDPSSTNFQMGLPARLICGPWDHATAPLFPRNTILNSACSSLLSQAGAGKGGWLTGQPESAVRRALRRAGCTDI